MVLICWRIHCIFSLLIKKFFVIVLSSSNVHQMPGCLFSKRCKMELVCKEKQETGAGALREAETGTK